MTEEKKNSGAGKFFLGAALGALAGMIAGHAIAKKRDGDFEDECDCEEDCDCDDKCDCSDKCGCKDCDCEKKEHSTKATGYIAEVEIGLKAEEPKEKESEKAEKAAKATEADVKEEKKTEKTSAEEK